MLAQSFLESFHIKEFRHSFIYQQLEVCTLSSRADTHALRLTARAPEIELTSEKAHIETSALTGETCNMVSTIPTFLKARHRPPKLQYVYSQRSGIAVTIGTCHNLCRTSAVRTRSSLSRAMVSQCPGQGRHGNIFLFVPKRNA
jgi:hypothetical protein